jgi:hypothetical protein
VERRLGVPRSRHAGRGQRHLRHARLPRCTQTEDPDRCYRVVWGAALASATNFAHEYETTGNALAGGYVGLQSLLGMVMFDEFLKQFEEGAATVRRENPNFGIRWLTWPTNTFLAAVAWRNHPPADGTPGTVANAVANLERVRALKQIRRRSQDPHAATLAPSALERDQAAKREVATMALAPVSGPRAAARSTRKPQGRGQAQVPTSRAKVAEWARVWTAPNSDPDLAEAALRGDTVARQHFGCSARQRGTSDMPRILALYKYGPPRLAYHLSLPEAIRGIP